ncbi:unnamed protein product [Eruca vesicaria subsp. sativa]|uniref:Uncharacterized protein n=1 Tax=Eruca vesicaria subsp. sativa TaxID=29727 RepID=A0ABC8JMF3_ERUVS|nr:unnamed protein product [Eruca vesicaria subsp. sativa]
MTKDKIIMDLTETTSVIFWGSVIIGYLSVGILGFAAVKVWNRWKLRHHEREQQQSPDEQRPEKHVVADETEDEDDIPDGALCVCALTVECEVNPKCPVCLQSIRGSMRVYYEC